MKREKIFHKILFCLFFSLGILSIPSCTMPWDHSWVAELEIRDVDLQDYPDGTYTGEFSYNRFTYIVESIVKNHSFQDIIILANRSTERAKMAEEVIDRVLQEQSLKVDTVTGATNTSKALLKALESGFLE